MTIHVLTQYKEMVANATSDLHERLQQIDNKLRDLSLDTESRMAPEDGAELEQIKAERDSTEQCLRICAQVSEHMDSVQIAAVEGSRSASDARHTAIERLGNLLSAQRTTSKVLQECKDKLALTTSELRRHLQEMNRKLERLERGVIISTEQSIERQRIHEEKESTEQCLRICTEAAEQAGQNRTNVVEDVKADQDSHQVVVATLGDLISAKRITAGARSAQWTGQMSDASLQQLSRDRIPVRIDKALEPKNETARKFLDQHGTGYKLNQGKTEDKTTE